MKAQMLHVALGLMGGKLHDLGFAVGRLYKVVCYTQGDMGNACLYAECDIDLQTVPEHGA